MLKNRTVREEYDSDDDDNDDDDDTNRLDYQGLRSDPEYEDYVDSDPINIVFAVVVILYVIALIIFYGFPVAQNMFRNDTILQVMVYWSLFKTLIPFLGVLFTVFNITNVPLTMIMVVAAISGLLNSVGFIVVFIHSGVMCNMANRPNNICSDLAAGCVFYNEPNSLYNISDGPCPSGYPQTRQDLKMNSSFIFYVVMISIIAALEIAVVITIFILRRTRAKFEKMFFKTQAALMESQIKVEAKVKAKNETSVESEMTRRISGKFSYMRVLLGQALSEMGKIPSQAGFTANMSKGYPYRVATKKNQ